MARSGNGMTCVERALTTVPRCIVRHRPVDRPGALLRMLRSRPSERPPSLFASALSLVLFSLMFCDHTWGAVQLGSQRHHAVAITPGAEAVLREDGRVVAFKNTAKDGAPVLIEGLTDVVAISGVSPGMLDASQPESPASWIALRRNGDVYQWKGTCAEDGYVDCKYTRASKVAGLSNITTISSSRGAHLALDRNGQVWGWGWDIDGLLTGAVYPFVKPQLALVKRPIRLPIPQELRFVAVGFPHAIGIDRAGGVWIWGRPDRFDAQPEKSQSISAGQLTFRKVDGLPPARSAVAFGRTYVLAETGEVWSWGITSYNRHESFGRRQPDKMDGACPTKALSVTAGTVVAVCLDGTVYRALWPGVETTDCCQARIVTEERWERVPFLSGINQLHVSNATFDVSLVDNSGDAYRDAFETFGAVLKPLTSLQGPLGLGR